MAEGKTGRDRGRLQKAKEEERELPLPDREVVQVPPRNKPPTDLKTLRDLGHAFRDFSTIPEQPAAPDPAEEPETSAEENADLAVEKVFDALTLPEDPVDPNDQDKEGGLTVETEMTPMEKLLADLAAEEAAIEIEERNITEERLTVPQLLAKIDEHTQAVAKAVSDKMPDVADRHRRLIKMILETSPGTKAAYDARNANAAAEALRADLEKKNKALAASRSEAIQEIERLMSEDPKGTESVLEAEHRLQQDPATPVKLLVRMRDAQQALLKVFSASGYNNSNVLKFEVLARTPDVHVPPTPTTVEEKQRDWKDRSFVPPHFVWDERRYPQENKADHYHAIKAQLAALRHREVSRRVAEDRLAQASQGAELSVTQLLVEGLPGKTSIDKLVFSPRPDSRATAMAHIVMERGEGDPHEMELFQGGPKAPFIPIRVLAFKVEPPMASLWALIAKPAVTLYVRASVAQQMADGKPVYRTDGSPRAIINVVVMDDPEGYPSFRQLEDSWRANNGKDSLPDTDGKVAELTAKENGWLEQFPVQKELLRYVIHRALLRDWLEAQPAPQAAEAEEAPIEGDDAAPSEGGEATAAPIRRRRASPALAK